jgi:hypothetical protein
VSEAPPRKPKPETSMAPRSEGGAQLDGAEELERAAGGGKRVGEHLPNCTPGMRGAVKTTDQRGVALPVVKRVKEARPLPLVWRNVRVFNAVGLRLNALSGDYAGKP